MRISYLSHTSDIRGGGERSLLELVRNVQETGEHDVTVITPKGPLVENVGAIPGVGLRMVEFTILRRSANPVLLGKFASRYAGAVLRLRRLLASDPPDVLHANSATAALYGGLATRGLDIPMVWHMRDIQPPAPTFRAILPMIGRMSTRVIAISEAVRDNLMSFGIDSNKITVVHNAVSPLELRGGEEFRRRHAIDAGDLVLGVVGQLLHRKGQLTAVRAFARIAAELPRAKLLICGGNEDSEYGKRVIAETARLGLHGRVVVTGFQPDVSPAFDAIDILLVPSNQEPFGRVVVESMFARKPIIATRVGGVPEIVRHEAEALLVEAADPDAMAAAIRRLLQQVGLIDELVDRAERRAQEQYAWAGRKAQVGSIYRSLHPQSVPA